LEFQQKNAREKLNYFFINSNLENYSNSPQKIDLTRKRTKREPKIYLYEGGNGKNDKED